MGSVNGWRRRIAIGGTFALLAAAVVLPNTFASGEVAGDPFGTSGILRLHLGAQDYFRYDPSDGTDPAQAAISSSACKLSVAAGSPAALSQIPTTTGSSVGFKDDSIGVKVLNEGSGTPCGQVNGTSQRLTLSLAGVIANKVADRAELDVELKFNAKLKADMYLDGTLQQTQSFTPCSGSDCGPDSADGDNYRVTIAGVAFDAIQLYVDPSTPNGAFSLEGGSDGTAPGELGSTLATNKNDTIFRISGAEGVLNCNETVTEDGAVGEPDATLHRLDNEGCKRIRYILDSSSDADSQDVSFVKDLSEQPNARFTQAIVWAPEVATYPLISTRVNEGSGEYVPDWCGGTAANPTLPNPAEHWCVLNETGQLSPSNAGLVQRTTTYYGMGDPGFTLPKLNLSS